MSKSLRASFVFSILWLPCLAAWAEGNCPSGYYPVGGGNAGWQGCAPMPSAAGGSPSDPGSQWATRWGGIAVDGDRGSFGGVEGQPNKRKAKQAALDECRKDGGKRCEVIATYYNQCGAMAWGDHQVSSYSGPDRGKTIDLAIQTCAAKSANCKAYYAGCSYPERIR